MDDAGNRSWAQVLDLHSMEMHINHPAAALGSQLSKDLYIGPEQWSFVLFLKKDTTQ